jgi:glycosyltransferase involved in cell wall biosynthesis
LRHEPHTFFKKVMRIIKGILLTMPTYFHPVGKLSEQYLNSISFSQKTNLYFPYTVDLEWINKIFLSTRMQKVRILKELGFGPNDFILVSAIKFNDREDPITLVDAFCEAHAINSGIKLILIGDGELKEEVREITACIKDGIFLAGYVDYKRLITLFSISDLYVHPAASEPYGVSVQEALACGLPVLASDMTGSHHDFIVEGLNGSVFECGNKKMLTQLILQYSKLNFEKKLKPHH